MLNTPLLSLLCLPALAAEGVVLRPAEGLTWEALNPARGDASPRAATLRGDRNGPVPTGFLVQFVDGFSSPPHVHNVSYRAVVIDGQVHNDDPVAEPMWMPPGSFWTQPGGQRHITSAQGARVVAYVEIDQGPYLVRPVEQAVDGDERPINVDPSNLVWLPSTTVASMGGADGVEVAFVWGKVDDGAPHGVLLRLAPGFSGTWTTTEPMHAVVVQGPLSHGTTALTAGSGFHADADAAHPLSCAGTTPCQIYANVRGANRITAAP